MLTEVLTYRAMCTLINGFASPVLACTLRSEVEYAVALSTYFFCVGTWASVLCRSGVDLAVAHLTPKGALRNLFVLAEVVVDSALYMHRRCDPSRRSYQRTSHSTELEDCIHLAGILILFWALLDTPDPWPVGVSIDKALGYLGCVAAFLYAIAV